MIRIFRTNRLKVHMAFEGVEYDSKYDKDSKMLFFFIWINENQSDNAIDIIIVIRFDDTFFYFTG